jgi:HK97 family phage prohead protease|tara:strand:- start:1216 stop:2550 length:1335 start_codon:yes stop_codon:yes gene_type:complete
MSESAVLKAVNPIRNDSFSILKSDDLIIGGYASIEMVDKQNDLITLDALGEAVNKYMKITKFRNVMTNHSNVQVGEVIPQYRDTNGKLWKTSVDDVGFFVVIKLREDIEKAKEVGREIRDGTLRSFSIGGQALEKKKKVHKEYGDYNEISKLELHEVTICEKGINPEAKFDILKMDKTDNATEIEKALEELNKTLEKINETTLPDGEESKGDISDGKAEITEKHIKKVLRNVNSSDGGTEMSDLNKEEYMDTEEVEAQDAEMEEKAMGDNPNMPEEEMENMDMEAKSKPDPATGQVEAGNASGYVDDTHDQMSDDGTTIKQFEDQSTLDLSAENLEKAYSEFKAEQLEKAAYEAVKNKFQTRFDSEMVAKTEEIAKSNYDAQAEVAELKEQFSSLLKSLTEEKQTVIRKQEEVVAELNIPSSDEIAKMDWSDINALVERLEGQI